MAIDYSQRAGERSRVAAPIPPEELTRATELPFDVTSGYMDALTAEQLQQLNLGTQPGTFVPPASIPISPPNPNVFVPNVPLDLRYIDDMRAFRNEAQRLLAERTAANRGYGPKPSYSLAVPGTDEGLVPPGPNYPPNYGLAGPSAIVPPGGLAGPSQVAPPPIDLLSVIRPLLNPSSLRLPTFGGQPQTVAQATERGIGQVEPPSALIDILAGQNARQRALASGAVSTVLGLAGPPGEAAPRVGGFVAKILKNGEVAVVDAAGNVVQNFGRGGFKKATAEAASRNAAAVPGPVTNEALAAARGEEAAPGTGGALKPGSSAAEVAARRMGITPEAQIAGAIRQIPRETGDQIRRAQRGESVELTGEQLMIQVDDALTKAKAPLTDANRLGVLEGLAKEQGIRNVYARPAAEARTARETAAVGEAQTGAHAANLPAPTGPTGTWATFLDVWNLPKALKASWDLSAPGRQGILTAAAHPREFFGNFKPMVKAFGDNKFALAVNQELRAGPKSRIVQDGLASLGLAGRSPRLYLAELGSSLSGREEAFMTRLAGKIPFVRNSERAYITYLNKLRADIYDNTLESWFRSGKNVTQRDVDGLADVVNHFTGRGDLTFGTQITPVLNGMFFSPRFAISRVQSVGDALGLLKSRDSLAAREAANMLVKSITAGVALLALAKTGGASVEVDPRSSNFGKIRVGDTSYDIWGGQQQIARYVAQFLTGQTKVATGPNAGTIQTANRGETVGRFLASKLSPAAGTAWDIISYQPRKTDPPGTIGRNFIGQPFSALDLINPASSANLITPLFGQDVADAVAAATGQGQSPIAGAVKGLPSFFGIGTNTLNRTPEQRAQEDLAKKWYAAPAFSIGNPTEWAAVYRALQQYRTLKGNKTVAQVRADPRLREFYNSAAGGRLRTYVSDSGTIRSQVVSAQRRALQKDPNFKNLGITLNDIISHLGQ